MTKNPFINALAASLYIIAVASFMFYGQDHVPSDDTVLMPIAMISLFTLSAAMMAYLFLSQPVQLSIDGKKKEALTLFLQTLVVFAGLTLVALLVAFV
jgi:hypothetical protein